MNSYRERLLTATHGREMLYPVAVTSQAFSTEDDAERSTEFPGQGLRGRDELTEQAASETEFVYLIGLVLRSQPVRALIHSLLAKINEQESGEPHSAVV